MIYMITRHAGALAWLLESISEPAKTLLHLDDINTFKAGDIVIGTLPINLVEQLCERNVRYFHLEMSLPFELRGKELTAQQLTACNARLVEYVAIKPSGKGLSDSFVITKAQATGNQDE